MPQRAGAIVREFIGSIVEEAEARMAQIREEAVGEADVERRAAHAGASVIRERIDLILGELTSLRTDLARESDRITAFPTVARMREDFGPRSLPPAQPGAETGDADAAAEDGAEAADRGAETDADTARGAGWRARLGLRDRATAEQEEPGVAEEARVQETAGVEEEPDEDVAASRSPEPATAAGQRAARAPEDEAADLVAEPEVAEAEPAEPVAEPEVAEAEPAEPVAEPEAAEPEAAEPDTAEPAAAAVPPAETGDTAVEEEAAATAVAADGAEEAAATSIPDDRTEEAEQEDAGAPEGGTEEAEQEDVAEPAVAEADAGIVAADAAPEAGLADTAVSEQPEVAEAEEAEPAAASGEAEAAGVSEEEPAVAEPPEEEPAVAKPPAEEAPDAAAAPEDGGPDDRELAARLARMSDAELASAYRQAMAARSSPEPQASASGRPSPAQSLKEGYWGRLAGAAVAEAAKRPAFTAEPAGRRRRGLIPGLRRKRDQALDELRTVVRARPRDQ